MESRSEKRPHCTTLCLLQPGSTVRPGSTCRISSRASASNLRGHRPGTPKKHQQHAGVKCKSRIGRGDNHQFFFVQDVNGLTRPEVYCDAIASLFTGRYCFTSLHSSRRVSSGDCSPIIATTSPIAKRGLHLVD